MTLIINHEFIKTLDGIDLYTHLIIVHFMHKVKAIKELKIPPRRMKNITKVGLFATRTSNRPNSHRCYSGGIIDRHRNIVKVLRLEAIGDTPILDIKPYIF